MAELYFGGSFNPIHHGHLICSRAVAEARGFERVILMPTFLPPHKPGSADLAEARDRRKMCQLATSGSPLFEVSDVEIARGGPSYTLDTARQLAQTHGGKIHWLIGADMLLYLPKWHRPLELLAEVHFVIMARPGWSIDWQTLPSEYRHLKANVVEAPRIDISASDVRRRIAARQSIDYLTPPAVCRYIHDRSLYSPTMA